MSVIVRKKTTETQMSGHSPPSQAFLRLNTLQCVKKKGYTLRLSVTSKQNLENRSGSV